MRFLTSTLLAVLASHAAAQDNSNSGFTGQLSGVGDLSADFLGVTKPAEWILIRPDATEVAIGEEISKFGWPSEFSGVLASSGEKYNLYARAVVPGTVDFLSVPANGNGSPVQLTSPAAAPISAGFFQRTYDADSIKKQIMDGLMAALEAVCEMPARPTQVRAKASAFGVVEFEGTWTANDLCKD